MTDATWISDEPRLASVVRHVLSRSRHSWARVLLVALLATAALVALRARKKPVYEATLYFRLEEGDVTDPDHTPPPPRDIREHIASVALSRQQLEQIMRKHRWSEARLARDREAAIAEFREDISINVERNYFIYERSAGDAPRSAEVTVSLAGSDEARTFAVLRDVGEAIQVQTTVHAQYLQERRELLGRELEEARGHKTSLQRTIESLAAQAVSAPPPEGIALRGRIAALETELRGALERETALERRAAEVAFSDSVERAQLGTTLELMDERVATFAPPLTPPQLALRAAVTFAVVLLLTALTAGVFDDRVHAPDDLEWWGLPLFAALPSFPGDDGRPYRARAGRPGRNG